MSRVITKVGALYLFGQQVKGLVVAKSGDRVIGLLKAKDDGGFKTLDSVGYQKGERQKIGRTLAKVTKAVNKTISVGPTIKYFTKKDGNVYRQEHGMPAIIVVRALVSPRRRHWWPMLPRCQAPLSRTLPSAN